MRRFSSNLKSDIREGLIAHWKLDEADGSSVIDSSVNGNHGSFVGSVNRSRGKSGNNLEFAGASYISIPFSNSFSIANNIFSISVWIYFTGNIAGRYGIYSQSNNESGSPWIEIGTFGSTYTNGVAVAVPGNFISAASNTIETNRWHHIVYTKSGIGAGTHAIYVDGQSKTLITSGASFNETWQIFDSIGIKIIGGRNSGSQLFTGKIDDLRIYNRTLRPDEVSVLYNR